jgi:hypothetical protein
VALDMVRMYRKLLRSHLLVMNINLTRAVLSGAQVFLVVRVRTLFS